MRIAVRKDSQRNNFCHWGSVYAPLPFPSLTDTNQITHTLTILPYLPTTSNELLFTHFTLQYQLRNQAMQLAIID